MKSPVYKPTSMLRKLLGNSPKLLIVCGALTISACSTTPPNVAGPVRQPRVSDVCPQPGVFANPATFKTTVKLKAGETATETIRRYKVSELDKNLAGQRLWNGMSSCRSRRVPIPQPKKPKEDAVFEDDAPLEGSLF